MNKSVMTYGFAGIVLSIVLIFVIPLPPVILDALLAFNIMGSGIVLVMCMTIGDPLEFTAFAPALLIATLFRLALEISATRLILTQGNVENGVGSIIPAFGALVVHGNLVVGIIVFAILITIQFVVIASGAQRVAEVAARFTLDAMPGKQMAIDADMHAGAIDGETARRKRRNVQREAEFYGAMDGAGKFVKGDAVAALVIVLLNLCGGVIVGVAYHRLDALTALNTFAILTIGNALVTTLPSFLLSASMGLMVTRVSAESSLGIDLATQMLQRPGVLRAAAIFALILALVPALPQGLFVVIACMLGGVSEYARRYAQQRNVYERAQREAGKRAAIRRPETALALVGVDIFALDFGADLGGVLLSPASDALLDRIGEVRRALAADIGLVLPGVRLRDDVTREPATYAIRIRDTVVATGLLRLDCVLAVAEEANLDRLRGERVRDPVYGMSAIWIDPGEREAALESQALVFDPISVIGSHIAECAREHAAMLFGRQEFSTILEHLRASVPTIVKEIGTESMPLATAHRVLEALFRERIWPRDIVAVLEALIDAASTHRDIGDLIEAVRAKIVPPLLLRRGLTALEPLVLGPEIELEFAQTSGIRSAARPELVLHLRHRTHEYVTHVPRERAALVCTAAARPTISEMIRRFGIRLDVFSYAELPPTLPVRPAGVVDLPALTAAAS